MLHVFLALIVFSIAFFIPPAIAVKGDTYQFRYCNRSPYDIQVQYRAYKLWIQQDFPSKSKVVKPGKCEPGVYKKDWFSTSSKLHLDLGKKSGFDLIVTATYKTSTVNRKGSTTCHFRRYNKRDKNLGKCTPGKNCDGIIPIFKMTGCHKVLDAKVTRTKVGGSDFKNVLQIHGLPILTFNIRYCNTTKDDLVVTYLGGNKWNQGNHKQSSLSPGVYGSKKYVCTPGVHKRSWWQVSSQLAWDQKAGKQFRIALSEKNGKGKTNCTIKQIGKVLYMSDCSTVGGKKIRFERKSYRDNKGAKSYYEVIVGKGKTP